MTSATAISQGKRQSDVAGRLASRIFHIHLEDISCRKHYHLIPGEGDIDFEEIFRALAGIDYEGFVTVELYTCPENPGAGGKKGFRLSKNIFLNRIAK